MSAEHGVYIATSRLGSYAHCRCGWSSEGYKSIEAATYAWANLHMTPPVPFPEPSEGEK